MRYVFRADASQSMGAGHVMRSSAIAEELIRRGEDVTFIGLISDMNWVKERIASLGFTRVYSDSTEFISNSRTDILILDSYEIPKNDPFIDQQNWHQIIAVVDEATPSYSCTLRVHPGLDSNWTGNSKTPILSGPRYIPIRSSLIDNMSLPSQEINKLKIAVVAGGSDPFNLVGEITRILITFSEDFEILLFSNLNINSTLDSRFRRLKIGPEFDELTKDVDLILTTASTTSLEFLARGLCVGIACAVDNQQQYYKVLGELGVASQFGFRSPENEWFLDKQKIYSLLTSRELRQNLKLNAKGLIDFNGAKRIVDVISTL
jgi:spore coat polysaccharide biosynthesis predicted glycosyltransferase SpsG